MVWGGRWYGPLLIAACACVQLREYEPTPLPPGCELPTGTGARIRVANLVASNDPIDVCVGPAGGRMRTLIASSGRDCPRGLAYGDVTRPFAAPASKLDLRVVPAGAPCTATPLAETRNLELGAPATIVYLGGGALPRKLVSFPDAVGPVAASGSELRVVHALAGVASLDVGFANSPRLPTEITTTFLRDPVRFAEATTSTSRVALGSATPAGYIALPQIPFHIAAAESGTKRALLLTSLGGEEDGKRRTLFAAGVPRSAVHPVRGLVCADDEVEGIRTRCAWSALPTLSVDVFNGQLYGPYSADEAIRRPAIIDALARRESDLMCLTAISRHADQKAILAATSASGTFPYAVRFDADLDTKPTHPADRSKEESSAFGHAPCAGTVTTEEGDEALSCLQANCSTTGTADGVLNGGSECISANCTGPWVPLLAGDRDHNRCFHCLILSALSGDQHSSSRTACQKDVRNYKHFQGQSRSMLLSRFPLKEPRTFVLPATSYTMLVHSARAEIEPGQLLDVYCAELSAALGDLLPYYGYYADLSKPNGWSQEQLLQAQRVVALVREQSGTRPAIIAGDWATSRAYESPDKSIVLDDQNGAVFDVLEAAFKLAVPKDFQPRCTECPPPENPYNGVKRIWQMKVYLHNLPGESAVDAQRFFTEFVVPHPSGSKVPLSDRFGFSVRILRPPP
jgi:hypothetical protein